MEYKPIRNKKIYEEVAEAIIKMVQKGQLQPGDKLDSVDRLSENFSVGKSAVREAISGLRSMGIVETKQGQGSYIKSFDASKFSIPVTTAFLMKQKDVKELYELRKILETGAASLAAEAHTEEDLLDIEKALVVMKNTAEDGNLTASADTDFHIAIVHATHNELLINLVASIHNLMSETIHETRKILRRTEKRIDRLNIEHERIFNAIKDRDAELARQYMFDHLKVVNEDLLAYMEDL